MPKGRRERIRRHLDYAMGNLDKYMKHMLDAQAIVAGDDPGMSEELEKMAVVALELQKLTESYKLSI